MDIRYPDFPPIDIFDCNGDWGYENYCYDKHSDGYFEHGEDYWYISDYLECIDTYIYNNFDYWSGGDDFEYFEYSNDLEEYNQNQRKYFIKIKFKNGKNRNFFIGLYQAAYEIVWDEEYKVSESDYTPSIFDEYWEICGTEDPTIRFPTLKFIEEFNEENEIYKEAMQIIKQLDNIV